MIDQKEYKKILKDYQRDMEQSKRAFIGFKEKMKYARQAFLNEIPEDIAKAASNEIYLKQTEVGVNYRDSRSESSKEQMMVGTCSKMLLPHYKGISKKMIENMTALSPRYEWDANSKQYVKTSRALEKELSKFYTKMNLGGKTPKLIKNFVRDGVFVQQTVFRELVEKVRKYDKNNSVKEEPLYSGGVIDYLIYNPMTCYFDWDADPINYRQTARFIIVTISDAMTTTALKARYPNIVKDITGNVSQQEDVMNQESINDILGLVKPSDTVVVREYYTNNGRWYTVVNDTYIVDTGYNSNGDMNHVPINVGFMYDDYITLWEDVKWPVAAMSNAFNQVADNNAFNNTSPIFTLGDIAMDALAHDTDSGQKVIQITPLNKSIVRAQDALYKFQIPEVTNGAMFMYERAKEGLYIVTGTNEMAFGMQEKQIRNETVANMIGDSLVRSDSDTAKRIENTFYNPVTWDILRIFYTRYNSFGFKEDNIPEDFLKNYRNIRVVNGSYLPSDRMVRLSKLQQALQLASQIPERTNLEDLFYDLYEAIGIVDPYRYLKTNEEFWAQELSGSVQQLLQMGAINEQQATVMIDSIKLIAENSELLKEEQ